MKAYFNISVNNDHYLWLNILDVKQLDRLGGKVFEMDGKTYSELDEVLDVTVYPVKNYIKEMVSGPKFMAKYDIRSACNPYHFEYFILII